MILSPNERLITICLHQKPMCSSTIVEVLNKGDTVITNNLRKMRLAKLVKYERTGTQKKYQLTRYGDLIYDLLSTHDSAFRDLIIEYNNKVMLG